MTAVSDLLNYHSIELACGIAWAALLLLPALYLIIIWRIRRKVLLDHFSDRAIELYYIQFLPFSPARTFRKKSSSDPQIRFKRDFDSRYGRRHYILPLLLFAAIAGIGMWVTARSVQSWLGFITNFRPFSPITISAFLGGYDWGFSAHFSTCCR